jgi:hypothetical protein
VKILVTCLLLLLAPALYAAPHPLEGKWLGGVDTDRGKMQIGLELKAEGGKLIGAIKSPHGDWAVKSVSESKGTYTITFDNGGQTGRLIGAIKDGKFSGEWDNSPNAKGTFSLEKPQP